MAIAGAVVDRLLRRLSSDPGLSELPSSIDEGAAHLRRTLARLQDALVSVERQGFSARREVLDWMGKIKEAAYDIEDLLDGFEDHESIGSQRSACLAKATSFCSSSPFLLHKHNIIGNRMKTLGRKLDLLAEDSVIFSSMQHSKCDLEQSDNPGEFDRAAFVGRDDGKTKIKDLFMKNDAETLCIIPIVGLVGLGKTTLARLLFHDKENGWNFDRRIWVNLNRKMDLKKIAIEMISQANETKGHSEVNTNNDILGNLQLLKNRLRELLHDKKCLIVLDDLCSRNKSQLDELKEMLRGTNKCIYILVTTSSQMTSEILHTVPPYKLLPLTEDDCWTIFSRRAFGDRDDVHACLKDIGKQIVKRCEGMPVLAHYLGSIVHSQPMDVWIDAKDEEIWKLENRFSPKIDLFSPFNQTYYDMSSALKLCLLYLSLFPKGSVIDKEKLIWQWIALDMIGSKHETLPSYVHGEMYVEDLLSVHFLKVRKTYPVCRMDNRTDPTMLYMHNFVHDFARHSACNDIILDDREMQSDNAKRLTCQYALLTNYRGQSTLRSSTLTRARALHLRNSVDIKILGESFELLKHLRVLNLSGCCIEELPASVGHLKYLTYLGVSDLMIQTLPSSMSNLTNLKALDLSKTSLRGLPYFIGTFPKLLYLNLQGCEKLQNWPPTLGHLQRLEHLRLSCCYDVHELPDSLCDLHDLRFLDVSRCPGFQQLPPLFGNLSNLEDLNMSSCFNLKKLPTSFGNLYFLRFLNLSGCYELRQLPGSLTNLKKLEVLILRRCYRLQNLPPFFKNRQHLRILDLSGCEALQVNTEILPTNLEYLNLERCQKLKTQPNCFLNFTKLKFLNLSQCLYTIDSSQALGYLLNLEYLNLSQTFLDIPVSFEKLQKLHMLDLTGCVLRHPSPGVPQILPDILRKMTGLKFVLTSDPIIVAFLPKHIQCSVSTDEHWHVTSDELFVPNLTGGSRGLGIAERANIQNRQEIRFLKLGWIPTSQSAAVDAVKDVGVEEVLEKLQPNQSLEHFELIGYAGSFFPTWLMSDMTSSLPNLVILHLFHLDNCKNLPPLCELQNLRYLHIKDMPNLLDLEMGLSGGPKPLVKLTHLKLETLLNLEELCIVLSINSEERFMFPALEELSVVSCSKLIFKPSFPKCLKYEIKESDNILSCGEPIGLSSSSPVEIEITGCRIPSKLLQWIRSLRTLEKAVIDSCVGEDGQVLTSLGPLEIKGNEELSSSYTANEITTDSLLERNTSQELATQVCAPTKKGHIGSLFRKLFPWFSASPDHKGPLRSLTFSGFTTSEDKSTISSSTGTFTQSTVTGVSGFSPPAPHRIPPSPSRFAPSPLIATVGSVNLTVQQILRATQNFSASFKLGEGGFGTVYRAVLPDGQIVAVKRAKKDQFAGPRDEFSNEVDLLAKIDHRNLVRLLGYTDKGNERILITEFVPNGTLREHLDGHHGRTLDFNQRLEIAIDVAHALTYLHLYAEKTIIHRDVKSSNILLTESYRAKVSDFGFARSGPSDTEKTHISTKVKGTAGYVDPEYLATSQLTPKSDVFSFGMLLFEILSARRPVELKRAAEERITISWTFKKFNEGNMREILDPLLEDHVGDDVLEKLLSLAFQCAAPTREDRPTMKKVAEQLWKIRKEYGKSIRKV